MLIASSCTDTAETGITSVSCPDDSTLTYANFGSVFIGGNCLSCHAARETPTLTTQAQVQVQSHLTRLLQQAVYTTAMPEDADIAIDERALLGEWLACGAP